MKKIFVFVFLSLCWQSFSQTQRSLTELEEVLTEALNYESRQKQNIADLNQILTEQRQLSTKLREDLAQSEASLLRCEAITREQSELLERQSKSLRESASKLRLWKGVSLTFGITTILSTALTITLWRTK